MPALRHLWLAPPHDPGRIRADDPRVLALLSRIAPDQTATDLGGSFSLNLHLTPDNRVLRVHRPFVSRRRILAEQNLRRQISAAGITVPLPLWVDGETIFAAGTGSRQRLAEVEPFIATVMPETTLASYQWLFREMGTIHRVLAALPAIMPRSLAATWGTPASLRRWLEATRLAVASDTEASDLVGVAESLLPEIRRRWISPGHRPHQVIHGDVRLGKCVRDRSTGAMVLFDTGFADVRPRSWDIAYALGFMALALKDEERCQQPALWHELLAIYDDARGESLNPEEREVLPAMAAIALLNTLAHAGYMAEPAKAVKHEEAFLRMAIAVLAS